jgi:signal transduction histidine kinase
MERMMLRPKTSRASNITTAPPDYEIDGPPLAVLDEPRSPALESLQFEQFLADLSARFINILPEHAEAEIEVGLRKLVEFLGIDRACFGQLCPDRGLVVLGCFANLGTDPFPHGPVPPGFEWYVNEIAQGRPVRYSDADDLGPQAAQVTAIARAEGIKYSLGVPIVMAGVPQYWQGIANIHRERQFSDDLADRLHLVGEIFASALARRDAELNVRRLQAELAHLTRVSTVGQLAASIAHELNQPICAIVNNAQAAIRLLALPTPDLAEVRSALTDIISDGIRTSQIVLRSHGMMKRREVDFTPIQMKDLIRDIALMVRNDAMIRRVNLRLLLPDELPMISGDRVQLQQVLLNLLVNAIDATADVETGPREITISALATKAHVQIFVRDTGKGLSPEVARRLFEPFFTTKQHGLGMGLPISQDIMKNHRGLLRAEPGTPTGTCFICKLPLNGAPPITA